MSMANSFEVRFPLIDHKVIEFVTGVDTKYRIKMVRQNILLKKIIQGKIPDNIINKPNLVLIHLCDFKAPKDLKKVYRWLPIKKECRRKGTIFNYEYIKQK